MALNDLPTVPGHGGEPPKPRRRSRWTRVLGWAAIGVVLLLVLVTIAAVAALRTERGSRELWSLATRLSGGVLAGQYEGGTFAHGLHLSDVIYEQGDTRVAVDRLDGAWSVAWHFGAKRARLHVASLQLGDVAVRLAPPREEPQPQPLTMPRSLEVPLSLDVDALTMRRLSIHSGPATTDEPLVFSDLSAELHSDGTRHRLSIARLTTPYGKLSANAQLGGQAPFPVNAQALLEGSWQREDFALSAQAGGTLEALRVQIDANGDRIRARGDAELTPFGPVPFTRLRVDGDRINPRLFHPGAPNANLTVRAELRPVTGAPAPDAGTAPLTVAGDVSVRNLEPGPIDAERLPVQSVQARIELSERLQNFPSLQVRLAGGGEIAGSGSLRDGRGGFDLDVRRLDPHALHGSLRAAPLSGPVIVRLEPGRQSVALDLAGGELKLFADARVDPEAVTLAALRIGVAAGSVHAEGRLGLKDQQAFAFKGRVANFDPSRLASVAAGRINANFNTSGTLAGEPRVTADFSIADSQYAGLPMTGGGKVQLAGRRLLPSTATLTMAGNHADLRGSFGAAGDRLKLVVDAPQLDRLKLGVGGRLQVDADIAGTLERPQIAGTYEAQALRFGEHRLASASGSADLRGGLDGPLRLHLTARGYRGPQMSLRTLDANLDGTQASHRFDVEGSGQLRRRPLRLSVAGQGGWNGERWSGTLATLEESGTFDLRLTAPATVSAGSGRLTLGETHMLFSRATIDIANLDWNQGRIRSRGSIGALQIAKVLELVQAFTGDAPPVRSDLVLDGRWDLDLAERAVGFAEVTRRSGDLLVNAGRGFTALGLQEAALRLQAVGERMQLRGRVAAQRVGNVDVDAFAGLVRQQGVMTVTPASVLGGSVAFDVPRLKSLEGFTGPQYGFEGQLGGTLRLAGTVGEPVLTGAVNGDDLGITLYDQGIRLTDGTVRLVLDRNVIELRQVRFHGGDGTLTASGNVRLGEADPALTGRIVADRLQLFASPERTLVLSGDATLANEGGQFAIRGNFRVDRGLFDLPKAGAPALGDDVVVVRRTDTRGRRDLRTAATPAVPESKPAGRFSPVIDLSLDLGSNFRFRGAGADLLLAGRLGINSEPLAPMRITGTVRVVDGTYEAFGRKLQITRGIVNFNGPADNPNLNIRAMRLNQEVEAGVEVTGTVRLPRVRLVSEPNVPDEDKLSWLMFGYGAESAALGQQQQLSGAALGGAALGMLGSRAGKNVVQRFGIDEFSIGPSTAGLTDQQVVSIGKAVSEKVSVGYEQSLTSAGNLVKLTWAFSRRWSLIAKGGSLNGLSLLFNRRFDDWSALFGGSSARRADREGDQDAESEREARSRGGDAPGDPTEGIRR